MDAYLRALWLAHLTNLALDVTQAGGDVLIEQALLFLINTLDCSDRQRGTLAHLLHDLSELSVFQPPTQH